MERVTSEMALAYVADTYGGKAEVLDVEVGTYEVIFRSEIDSDALVTVSLDGEEFQVYVETRPPQLCADNRSGLALGKGVRRLGRGDGKHRHDSQAQDDDEREQADGAHAHRTAALSHWRHLPARLPRPRRPPRNARSRG